MFVVEITAEARTEIVDQFAREAFVRPGLMIHRQGPKGDVTRSSEGEAKWQVERPHPWHAQVGDFHTFGENAEDVSLVNGILVWLALIPRPGESGVRVSTRSGQLFVEPRVA
jgi:hypothetical protein